MQFLKVIAANTFFQILARVISSGTSFVITLLIARSLGVIGYGDLAKIIAFVSIFYLLVDLGLNAIFLQLEEHEEKFKDLLYFRLFLALCLFLLVSASAMALPYSPQTGIGYSPLVKLGIVLFSLTFFARALSFSTSVIFQKTLSYKYATISSLVASLATLAVVAFTALSRLPLLYVVGAYVIGAFVEGLVGLFLVKENLWPLKFDTRFVKTMTLQTLPITMMLLLNLIYFRIDMVLLSLMKSTTDVALYDFAYKFFDFLIALPLFLSNSLYPSLLDSVKNTRIAFPKVILFMFSFFVLGIVVAIPVWFLSPLLGLVKHEFALSSLPLRLLTLSLPVFFATNILQWILIAKKKQLFLLFVYGGAMIVNILLNLWFIPHYSYVASAIITGISESVVLLLLWGYFLFNKNL